jgi:hypothetical protein
MTPQEAHKLLDRVRDGQLVPLYLINRALKATGDKTGWLGHE